MGQRVRYRPCNIQECSWDTPGFRELQCAEFNGSLFFYFEADLILILPLQVAKSEYTEFQRKPNGFPNTQELVRTSAANCTAEEVLLQSVHQQCIIRNK